MCSLSCLRVCIFPVFHAHCRKQSVDRIPEKETTLTKHLKTLCNVHRYKESVYIDLLEVLALFWTLHWYNIIEGWNPQRPQLIKKGDLFQVSPACVDGWHPWCADLCWTGSRQDGSQGTKPLGNHRRPFLLVQILSRPAVKAVVNSFLWGWSWPSISLYVLL